MDNKNMITLETLLQNYEVEMSFINALQDFGLVTIVEVDGKQCFDRDNLADLEKMIRLHYDLDINLAGIDVICNMLRRMNEMQAELTMLKNRLDLR
jgi:chaperone modulatory protein CbpM